MFSEGEVSDEIKNISVCLACLAYFDDYEKLKVSFYLDSLTSMYSLILRIYQRNFRKKSNIGGFPRIESGPRTNLLFLKTFMLILG